MLQVRKPRSNRERQAPAEEARMLEYDVDVCGAKGGRGGEIDSGKKCARQPRMISLEGSVFHDLDAWDFRKSRQFVVVVRQPGKHDRLQFTRMISMERDK
ncbi:hypothetical protein [Bradyrhizobium sp. USDA 4469]